MVRQSGKGKGAGSDVHRSVRMRWASGDHQPPPLSRKAVPWHPRGKEEQVKLAMRRLQRTWQANGPG